MKLFIWDFHGTLEKGNGGAVVEITNRILQDAGYEQRMDEVLDNLLAGKKWYEYFDLSAFLNITRIDAFFPTDKYFGRDGHRPDMVRSKKEIAEEYLVDKDFEKIIVIGDSPQDMIPLPNAITYLYTHEGKEFKECEVSYRIRDLREVLREL